MEARKQTETIEFIKLAEDMVGLHFFNKIIIKLEREKNKELSSIRIKATHSIAKLIIKQRTAKLEGKTRR